MKNKFNISVVLNVKPTDTVEHIVQGYNNIAEAQNQLKASSAQASEPYTMGVLEKKWCKWSGKSRVRATEGRSREEQAKHNLVKYAGFDAASLA